MFVLHGEDLILHPPSRLNLSSTYVYDIRPSFLLQDIHGNTALHIAVAMGRKDCIQLLLAHNSPVKLKNTQGERASLSVV